MRLLGLLLVLLWVCPVSAQAPDPETERLQRATDLAVQLGDHSYTLERLPELEQRIDVLERRAEELERKGDELEREAEGVEDLAERISRDAESGYLDPAALSELLQQTGQISRKGAEMGAEGAAIGAEGAAIGAEAAQAATIGAARALLGAEVSAYAAWGIPSRVLRRLDAEADIQDNLFLDLQRLQAARQSGQPVMVSRVLPKVREKASKQDAASRLARFIADTVAFQENPESGLKAHLRARRMATSHLSGLAFSTDVPPRQWAWALESEGFWLRSGMDTGPDDAGVEDAAATELGLWIRLMEASLGHEEHLELAFGVPELVLGLGRHRVDLGDVGGAKKELERATGLVQRVGASLKALEPRIAARYPGLRVSRSPRFLSLQGRESELRGRIAYAEGQPWETPLLKALELYRAAEDSPAEAELLMDWPQPSEDTVGRLEALANLLSHRPAGIVARSHRAALAYRKGDLATAEQLLTTALGQIEDYAAQGITPAEERRFQPAYQLKAELALASGNSQEALSALSRGAQVQTAATLGSQAQTEPVRAVHEKGRRVRALEQEETAVQALPEKGRAQVGGDGQLLASSKQEFVTEARALRDKHPEYASLLFVDPVEFSKLQSKIPADTLVIQYFPTRDGKLYSFLVTSDAFRIRSVDIAWKDLDRSVRRYRALVGCFPVPTPVSWIDDGSQQYQRFVAPLKQVTYELYKVLLDPLEEEIAGRETLAIIPTSTLHYLPFPALAREDSQGNPEFLIQRKRVVVLSKASDLALLGDSVSGSTGLLAFGNPDGSLPQAKAEVEELGKLFPEASVYVGEQATKARLVAASGQAYLHLATHASLDSGNPGASYMVLAGEDDASRLHPAEIFGLPLKGTRMVTLSACETALGTRQPGAEITSLAEAFWVAGPPTVVASLWKVSDSSTQELMVEFYRGLKSGEPTAQALQAAQVKLLGGKFNHPHYWAPFVLLGDWR